MALPNDNKKEITNEEKYNAIIGLREDVSTYTKTQLAFDAKLNRVLNWIKWMSFIVLLILIVAIGIVMYLRFRKPPASQITLQHIEKQSSDLANREKLFLDAREVFLKEKQTFDQQKAAFAKEMDRRRTDLVTMQQNIFKLDSINKAKLIKKK